MYIQSVFRLFRTPASLRKMSLFSCISSQRSDVHSVSVQAVQNSCQREEDVPVQLYPSERSLMHIQSMFRLFRTPASVRKMSLFSCISSEGPQSPATFPPQRFEPFLNEMDSYVPSCHCTMINVKSFCSTYLLTFQIAIVFGMRGSAGGVFSHPW
jgi:hypothetical protein